MEDPEIRRLIDMSRGVEGMPRHASTHAAGVVITGEPTWKYVPLSNSGTGIVTQFDMNTDAALGLVKFDFLGLRYITVVHEAESLIRRRIPDFDISRVGFDDPKTFKLLADARTDGVFQLESGGMKSVLTRLAPTCFEDIIACIALFRPGPMDSIDKFIARKHGREKTVYTIDALRDILDVTYGCIVYQEQVMQICRRLAGYSYARADIVRRAMSKKKESAMEAEREAFIEGCRANGFDEAASMEIFEEMVGFAKYAFNKSHATVYAVTSYRTAYLKAHYPAEYYAALLSSVLDNQSKLKSYIADASKLGVSVLPPDINKSEASFTVTDGAIRFGLVAIKNVGSILVDAAVAHRMDGPYKSFDDFVERLSDSSLNKRTLESLIKCGVFDSLGVTRSSLLSCYEDILESVQNKRRQASPGQLDIFSAASPEEIGLSSSGYEYPDIKEFSLKELLLLEKECSGMYFSGHLIDDYSSHMSTLDVDRISDILDDLAEDSTNPNPKFKDKSSATIAGIITSKKTKTTKNGTVMAFITVEDRFGDMEVIVFGKQYARFSSEIFVDNAVCITGNISCEVDEDPRLLLSELTPLVSNAQYKAKAEGRSIPEEPKKARLFIKVDGLDDSRISIIQRMSALNRGTTQIVLFDTKTSKYMEMKGTTINITDEVISRLRSRFGESSVVLK